MDGVSLSYQYTDSENITDESESENANGDGYETMYVSEIDSRSASSKHTTSPWLYVIIAVVVCAAVAVTVIVVKKHRSKA